MQIEGMDCASCVAKIEMALQRIPGVSEVQLNYATEKLAFRLDADAPTNAGDIEKTIGTLGFTVVSSAKQVASAQGGSAESVLMPARHWWQHKKGKLFIGLGILMCVAYLISMFLPQYGHWVWVVTVLLGVFPFARQAVALAIAGTPFSIETLMSVAALGALFIGEAAEAAAVVVLFSLGELLESVAAGRARSGIKTLLSLVPKTATVLLDGCSGHAHSHSHSHTHTHEHKHGHGQKQVPVSALRINDRVLVKPGDQVPADGLIVEGASSLDESPITGESVPVAKTGGDRVFAGSINIDGVLQVKVEKKAEDNTISRIIQLVEQAQASKAPVARFIENFSRYYTPAVMLIAALVMLVPPLVMGQDWDTWVYRGLALLLIACPCALVLSTPAAIASGLAVGTRRGLLVKGGGALEAIGKVNVIAFDKTGTLTEGKPQVTDIVAFAPENEQDILAMAAAVEFGSSHPLAKAIVQHAESAGVVIPPASQASATAGKAVHAKVAGRDLSIGSPVYAESISPFLPEQKVQIEALQNSGKTVSVLLDAQTGRALGLIALRDEARKDAQEGLVQLKAMGVRPVMLTGDNRHTAKAIATNLGVDWEAELLPEDKLGLINKMKGQGMVAMVGDGINDAPALATADVGIAMGGGTDVAMETADAALLKSRVTDVAHLVALSRATMANIKQNVVFALGLKGLFLLTTVLGVTGLWMAVLADTGATALVTLNALRLLRFNPAQRQATTND
ncbi:MAG: heavy metal translocating P-type ATPase [Alcaligenaceae bacterium]|nr:heavy metal translocating P-type ATPase [Alcaligenaceae bacterium]